MSETSIQRYARYLADSQYWPKERREAIQRKSLVRMVKHAYEQTEANRDRLAPLFRKGDEPDLDRWDEIPIMTRADLQADPDAYFAREVPARTGKISIGQTSGSSGRPIFPRTSAIAVIADVATVERGFSWYRLDGAKRVLYVEVDWKKLGPEQPTSKRLGWRNDGTKGECLKINRLHTTSEEQAEWILEHPASYLSSSPSSVIGILDAFEKSGAATPRFEAIILTGEVLTDRARQRISDELSGTIINVYGSQECGRLAVSCPECGLMHLAEENLLFEFDQAHPDKVQLADARRIIVSNYFNFAMPLLRYEVGDWAQMDDKHASCSRSGRHVACVLGRERSLWKFPDGTAKWATIDHVEFEKILPKCQWQFIQTARDQATVNLVSTSKITTEQSKLLQALFRNSIHQQVNFNIRNVSTIERNSGGKFSEFISIVP